MTSTRHRLTVWGVLISFFGMQANAAVLAPSVDTPELRLLEEVIALSGGKELQDRFGEIAIRYVEDPAMNLDTAMGNIREAAALMGISTADFELMSGRFEAELGPTLKKLANNPSDKEKAQIRTELLQRMVPIVSALRIRTGSQFDARCALYGGMVLGGLAMLVWAIVQINKETMQTSGGYQCNDCKIDPTGTKAMAAFGGTLLIVAGAALSFSKLESYGSNCLGSWFPN